MSANSQPSTSKLLHVQALRALAAMFVVVTHSLHEVSEIFAISGLYFNEKIFPGDFGVDVFFVISGFIMVYVSRNHFGSDGQARGFLVRRIIRIVPLYWLMSTVILAIVLLAPSLMDNASRDPIHWLASYLFIPIERPGDGLIRPLLSLGWTLEYEMFFYLIFASVLALPMKRALPILVGTIVMIVLVGGIFQPQTPIFRFLSNPVMLEFAAGALLGWAYVKGLRVAAITFWPVIIVSLFALSLAPEFMLDMEYWRFGFYGVPALAIVGVSVLSAKINHRPVPGLMVSLGASSYALYLAHPFVLGGLKFVWTSLAFTSILGTALTPWIFVIISIGICALAGHLLHLGFEKPVTRWLSNRNSTTEPAVARLPPNPVH